MKKTKRLKMLTFLILTPTVILGQALTPVQIKSPQSYAFEKQGNVPVNLYTGTLDLKIPIYSLSIGNGNNIDVTLSYDSSGFIPRKKSDYAGMNWSLLAGGRITRSMKRIPDEYKGNPTSFGGNPFDTGMDLHGFLTGVRLNSYTNADVYNLNSGAGHANTNLAWMLGTDQTGYEGEPDVFNFNVLGLHGKFMIGNDGNPVVESNDPNVQVNINGLITYGGVNFCKPPEQIIEIIDGQGTKYIFGGDFSKYELSYNYSVPGFSLNGWFKGYPYINSFSISKIIFTDGRTVIFDYVQDTLESDFCNLLQGQAANVLANSKVLNFESYFQDGARTDEWTNCPGGNCGSGMASTPTVSQIFTLTKRSILSSIKYNDQEIKINYKDIGYPIKHSNESHATNFNEILINNIEVYTNNRLIQNDVFTYDNLGGINQRPFLKNIIEQMSNKTYGFEYYNTSNLPEYSTKGLDHWGYWNGKDSNISITPFDTYNVSTGDYTLNNTSRDADVQKYNVGLLSKIIYPTKGYTLFEYEPQYYGKRIERNSFSAFLPTLTNNSGLAGGARIKKQYDYTADGTLGNEKEYKYTVDLQGTISSGILMNWPRYFYYIELSGGGSTVQKLMLKTSSNVQQNSLDSYNIGYSKVFEIDTNKGYTEHTFTNYETHPDLLSDASNIKQYMTGYTNFNPPNLYQNLQNLYGIDKSAFRGKLLSQKIYTQQNLLQPIKTIEYEYTDIMGFNPNSMRDDNNYVSIHHLSGDWVQGYRRFMNSSYPKKKTVKDFLGGNNVSTTTDYFYEGNYHNSLTKTKTTYSSGETIEERVQYCMDLNHGNFPQQQIPPYQFVNAMARGNMHGIPLVKTIYKNGLFLKREQDLYNYGLHRLSAKLSYYEDKLKLANIGVWVPDTSFASTEITYNQYDDVINLQQYTTKSGLPVSVIWGYNKTQPIAKIEGVTYDQLVPYITDIINASNNDAQQGTEASEQLLISALDLFRNNSALSIYQITTYTYDPLIGVRSITPPSGIREVYIYDSANRLKEIRENNQTGNLLKEFKYNYKQ